MILRSIALLAAALAAALPALSQEAFRAPRLPAVEVAHLAAPAQKSADTSVDASGRLQVGVVRPMPKAARAADWTRVEGGYVSRFRVTSESAEGIRVRLDLGAVPGDMQLRAQGADLARVESMTIDARLGPEAWTPWTAGESQVVEIFSPVLPVDDAVSVGGVGHFTQSPFAKKAMACTLPTACTSGDESLDALIAERKRSSVRMLFSKGGRLFTCSGTLIDTPQRPAAYVLTANHCIDDGTSAASISSFWFYESTSCEDSTPMGFVQRSGGMTLVFASFAADQTLLLLNTSPPAGAVYAPLDPSILPPSTPVVSISHPDGDTTRWATGTTGDLRRYVEFPYQLYSVFFDRGIIQGGSSGSGIFTTRNGRLELRGVLSLGAVDLDCTRPNLFTYYGRLEVFYPQIARYIGAASAAADDTPNRPQEVTATVTSSPIDTIGSEVVVPNRRIDYAGDVDLFKFTLANQAVVSAYTLGSVDTVGTLYDSLGHALESIDDSQVGDTNTGITRTLAPGSYYFGVSDWNPQGTGPYEVRLRADRAGDNYTSLWWDAAESGWGINVNHQGDIVFATLFTYNPNGSPVWLVMSAGELQPDGSYLGPLYRTTGPPFNAVPWRPINATQVGTMRLSFPSADAGVLSYTFNGVQVTKNLTRQAFKALPSCKWSAFDRSWATNFQDLWWNPAESGWGVNIAHQDDTLFATLFTYGADGQPMWYVLPDGARTPGTATYSGPLYRTTGPAFNTVPWIPISAIAAGTMTFTFTSGNAGTMTYTVDGVQVTKQIQRQVFRALKTECES